MTTRARVLVILCFRQGAGVQLCETRTLALEGRLDRIAIAKRHEAHFDGHRVVDVLEVPAA